MAWNQRKPSSHFIGRRFVASPPARILILLALAALIGVVIGLALPKISRPVGEITGQYVASGPAADTLTTLTVDDRVSAQGYDRNSFGYRQTDVNGNGCDVRDDVLARDLSNVAFTHAGGCVVKTGTLHDPYTGKTIAFVRGAKTSGAVQIDHVVALENAWQSGARSWQSSQRMRFGNDMVNLLAVDGPANEEKGSASAAYWLPTNGAYRCAYVARQIGVKSKYGLSVTTREQQAMMSVLRSCPNEQVPRDGR